MRLFTAINFSPEVRNLLYDSILKLKDAGFQGNFTRKENLHLTVVFIGETNRIDLVRGAMQQIKVPPFAITIDGLGAFKRSGGDLYWAGIKSEPTLQELYRQLTQQLKEQGFSIEDRPYKPHLTLGRKMLPPEDGEYGGYGGIKITDINLPQITHRVDGVSLMQSERMNGRLTYTEVYRQPLRGK